MNYFPYFRGKQYELICIRENSKLISAHGYTPIIEPVKEASNGLLRALEALKAEGAPFLVVANPAVGHHVDELPGEFIAAVTEMMTGHAEAGWLYQIRENEDLARLKVWLQRTPQLALLHDGAVPAKDVLTAIGGDVPRLHIFTDNCSTRYRGSFVSDRKVILSNGFKKRKNADYPDLELFSELRVTYGELGATGFGDFLIVGSEYSEGGGAAYAVAIHVTYIDREDDGVVYIRHFVSDTNDTPTDPAGKFREALEKLVRAVNTGGSKIEKSGAILEFERLYSLGHYPGLGYVKKLSMQHHLEIMG